MLAIWDETNARIIARYGYNEREVMELSVINYLNKFSIITGIVNKNNKRIEEMRNKHKAAKGRNGRKR